MTLLQVIYFYLKLDPEVFCGFCGDSCLEEYKLLKLGPFYGPVKKGNNKFYFHELCAIWTPAIYLDDNGKLKNVHKEIKRSRKLFCSYCGLRGAGLGCSNNNCKNNYFEFISPLISTSHFCQKKFTFLIAVSNP